MYSPITQLHDKNEEHLGKIFYFTRQYVVPCHREVGSHITRRNRFYEGDDNRGMIGNEVLENHVRGWDDHRYLRPTNQRRGAGGGQQFFASLLIERKRFILQPQSIRELTAVGYWLRQLSVSSSWMLIN